MALPTLRSTIGFCRFDGCTIILDTVADRYWRADEVTGHALEAVAAGHPLPSGMAERLQRLGLLEAGEQRLRREPLKAGLPATSALEHSDDQACTPPRTRIPALTAQLWARCLLAVFSLEKALACATAIRAGATRRSATVPLDALARAFQQHRTLLPWTPLCLPDTIAFLRFAARYGHAPNLVIGVEAYPFAAHCWAQAGDMVLNDACDHAARFRPILVI